MSELIPEMITSGVEQMVECENEECDIYQTVVRVYLAMEAIRAIAEMKKEKETVH